MFQRYAALAVALVVALAMRRLVAPHIPYLRSLETWPGWLRAAILLGLVLTLGQDMLQGHWLLTVAYGVVIGLYPVKSRPKPPSSEPSTS